MEKIAIYIHEDGDPTHVAKLVSPAVWHSKLGELDDIHHPLEALLKYGTPTIFMSRKKLVNPRPNKKAQKRASRT